MIKQTRVPNRVFRLEELERPDFKRLLREFDRIAQRENISYFHPSKRWEYPWALEQASLKQGTRILDVGCGASIFPLFLARRDYNIFAVDRDIPGRLDSLHNLTVKYVRADLESLPFENESFDTLFCLSVLEHLPPERVSHSLSELWRVLTPRGSLMITTDFHRSVAEKVRYEGPGQSFEVDWHIFDEARLSREILQVPGFQVEGDTDLYVDWDQLSPHMVAFHGYPYTSVGIHLIKTKQE